MQKVPIPTVLILLAFSPASAEDTLTAQEALSIAIERSPQMVQAGLALRRSRESLNALRASQRTKISLQLTPIDYADDPKLDDRFNIWYRTRLARSLGALQISRPVIWSDGRLSLSDQMGWQQAYSDYQNTTDQIFNHSLSLSYTQPIFTYNRAKQELQTQQLDIEKQMLAFDISKLSVESAVATRFYALYRSQMELEFAQDECANQRKSLAIVEAKVTAGLQSKDQMYQAQLNLASSETELRNKEIQLLNAADVFKRQIGIALDSSVRVRADIDTAMAAIDSTRALEHALASRAELRQREIDIEKARFALVQAAATNEFRGDLTASIGFESKDSYWRDALGETQATPRGRISLQIPLWDWGERKARMKASEAGITTAQISLDEEKTDITMAVRQSCRAIRNLYNQIATSRQSAEFAQLTYELNLERYERGDLTSMDLQDYQTQLTQKRMSLVTTLISYRLELLNLKIISLWDFERNEPAAAIGHNAMRKDPGRDR